MTIYILIITLSPNGVRRARVVLGDSEAQDPWWCGDAHLPDMVDPCAVVRA